MAGISNALLRMTTICLKGHDLLTNSDCCFKSLLRENLEHVHKSGTCSFSATLD